MVVNQFGKALQAELRARKIQQKEFAKRAGISESAITKYVTGVSTPTRSKVEQIETALNVEPGTFGRLVRREDFQDIRYSPSKQELVVLQAWKRGERSPEEVARITGLSMRTIGLYLPLGLETEYGDRK